MIIFVLPKLILRSAVPYNKDNPTLVTHHIMKCGTASAV